MCALFAAWAVTVSTILFVPLLAAAVVFSRSGWRTIPAVSAGALYGMGTAAVAGTTGEVLGVIAGSAPILAAALAYVAIRDPFHGGGLVHLPGRVAATGRVDAAPSVEHVGATRYDRYRQASTIARQLPATRPQLPTGPYQRRTPLPPPAPDALPARPRLAIEATSREDQP
jgi:hypothetical protein